MEADLHFDKGAVQRFAETLSALKQDFLRNSEEGKTRFDSCREAYTRIRGELEQDYANYRMRRDWVEQRYSAAQVALKAERAKSDEDGGQDRYAIECAQEEIALASTEMESLNRKIRGCQEMMGRLQTIWDGNGNRAGGAIKILEDSFFAYRLFSDRSIQDLEVFMDYMEKSKKTLQENTPMVNSLEGSAVSLSGGNNSLSSVNGPMGKSFPGWCKKNHMRNVYADENGKKCFHMNIGGSNIHFPCTASGAAKAYRAAVKSGDSDLIARTSAIYEVEILRADLELGTGDDAYPQLGGYHADVSMQDPSGFESHHIPSRSIQDENAKWLPTISISRADHERTSSYSGKQRRVYEPVFGSGNGKSYKTNTAETISKGSCGYIQVMKNEILDLVRDTGHRYDGGISAYFDAVVDMLAGRGIPGEKK